MKKAKLLVSLLSVACLVGCGQNGGGNNNGKNKIVIEDFGVARFEAEDFDTSAWYEDESYDDTIIESSKASGGKYLAAADKNGSTAKFSFELKKYSRVIISAAYAQMDADKGTALDMSKVYDYTIKDVSPLAFGEGKSTLAARSDAETWSVMPYLVQTLYPGTYNVTLTVKDGAPACPSIDYIEFKTSDATTVDPSNLTEADIPDNDFRNLQQYKYLQDDDVYSYLSYATGGDFSAPRGMKLRFEDVDTASKYYVQVAESEAGLNSAAVRETTENKVYTFYNAKLGTKYYYRAATSEAGLANAEVKNITSSDVAPRVVYVPDVLNFRDIGGWETSLVQGAKLKQGLYFRCAQLNGGGGSTTSKLDSAGKGLAAIKELGIKQDIDMRDSPASTSPANTSAWPITMVQAAVRSGTESVRWEGGSQTDRSIAQQYVKIFNAIAKCDTDPVMLHCTYGADRTGIVTFFLESLLGMSQEDMTRDYLWTQFTQGRAVKILESEGAEFPQWINKTQQCAGESFAEKMKTHLMDFGIAESTLEHIREIFIPGYVAKA